MSLLVLATLASVAYGQLCTCFRSSSQGYWQSNVSSSLECNQCLPGFTGSDCKQPLTFCDDTITCSGNGVCDSSNRCQCNTGFEGDFCDRCSDNTVQFPWCSTGTKKCDDQADCNFGGTCPSFALCGPSTCDSSTERCCASQNPLNPSQVVYACVNKHRKCCGAQFYQDRYQVGTEPEFSLALPFASPVTRTCAWNQVCADAQANICIPEQRELCAILNNDKSINRAFLGDATWDSCTPKEKCCDGRCCQQHSTCRKSAEPREGWTQDNPETKYCEGNIMIAPTFIRSIVLPIFMILVTLVAVGILAPASASSPGVLVLSMLLILCSLLALFSHHWPYALLIILTALFSMGAAGSSGKHSFLWAVVFQFSTLVTICGGMNLGLLFSALIGTLIGTGEVHNPMSPLNADGRFGWNSVTALAETSDLGRCIQMYGHFVGLSPAGRKWDEDPVRGIGANYCSREWLSAGMFFQILSISFMLLLLVRSSVLLSKGKSL